MDSPLMEATGVGGRLLLFEDKVRIQRKGALAKMTHGLSGDKDILISQISSIQMKRATNLTSGFIQFAFAGGLEAKRGLGQATSDENTVVFRKGQQADFEAIKSAIERRMSRGHQVPQSSSTGSAADEIEKLASLKHKGLLTDEEFEAKKRQLLGL